MKTTLLSVVGFLLGVFLHVEAFEATNATHSPITNMTIINGLRGFQVLHMGTEKDYFVSTQRASAKDAIQTCQSIGPKYHLVAFENEQEYSALLPYLRSLNHTKLWTSGIKENQNSSVEYEWTQPSPPVPMDFINFPSPYVLGSLVQRLNRSEPTEDLLPKCKNGFLTPKCSPGVCEVTLEPCTTQTPDCEIVSDKPCTVIRPDCGATCNNCTIEQPTCVIVQEPCTVVTKPCIVQQGPCTVRTPPCVTTRPPCTTYYPPCEVTTPQPCTTTTKRPCTTVPTCTTVHPPCENGKCPPPVTKCKPIFKCDNEPEICFPGAIICPTPVTTCPEEETTCPAPVIDCPDPTPFCPAPEVDCPLPRAQCTKPKINCEAPEVNCPGIVVSCPAPSVACGPPKVECPPIKVDCEDPTPCNYPSPPPPCPFDDEEEEVPKSTTPFSLTTLPPKECDDCQPEGCVALRRETGFKWKVENCSEQFNFICEGKP